MFTGIDTATQAPVVIRTFVSPMTPEQREHFLDALAHLCETPLDHAAIASPLACGEVDGVPFLVHEFLPGQPLDEYLGQHGRRQLSEVSLRITHLAGAIDYAAAAGVVHGALGPRDLLFASDSTGITGFGIAQALNESGVEPGSPSTADDIYALGAMTFEMLAGERFEGGDVRAALATLPFDADVNLDALAGMLQATLSPDPLGWPTSALQFAASLHDALATPAAPADGPGSYPDVEGPGPEVDAAAASAHATPPLEEGDRIGAFTLEADPAPRGEDMPPRNDGPPHAIAPDETPSTPSPAPQPAPVLPLFDAPIREPEPAFAMMPGIESAPEIPLRGEAVTIRREPRRDGLHSSPLFTSPAGRSGPNRLVQAAVAVVVVVLLVAGFALFADRSWFEQRPETGASAPVTSPDARVPEASGSGANLSAPADQQAFEPGMPAGVPTRPAPVLSDDGIAEREAAAAPVVPEPPDAPTPQVAARPGEASATSNPRGSAASGPSAPTRAAAEPPTGRVLVRSDPPGARVLVGDQLRGETPVAIRDLPLGTHTITVSAPGVPAWRQQVTLTADRPAQSFEIALGATTPPPAAAEPSPATTAATLQVDSRPVGAQVWIDGRLVGTTPLQLSGVEEGSHAVRLELRGYRPWTTSVSVARGARARVAASLEQ